MALPHVICHMLVSLDGKVTGDFLQDPAASLATEEYYRVNRFLGADAYACGRVTMAGSFPDGRPGEGSENPAEGAPMASPEDYIADPGARFFAVCFDRMGRLGWSAGRIEDEDPGYGHAHIVEVLLESAPAANVERLKKAGCSIVFAGRKDMDLALALEKLSAEFGIRNLLLEGGSILNGAFARAGLIDELSLVVAPIAANAAARPLFDQGVLSTWQLASVEQHGNVLWLRYRKPAAK